MSEDVSRQLGELHDRLDAVDDDDDPGAADLKAAVAAYDAADEGGEGFLDQLREAALRYETSHPALSSAIARVVDSLTAAGL